MQLPSLLLLTLVQQRPPHTVKGVIVSLHYMSIPATSDEQNLQWRGHLQHAPGWYTFGRKKILDHFRNKRLTREPKVTKMDATRWTPLPSYDLSLSRSKSQHPFRIIMHLQRGILRCSQEILPKATKEVQVRFSRVVPVSMPQKSRRIITRLKKTSRGNTNTAFANALSNVGV